MQLRFTPGIKYQEHQMQLRVHLAICSWNWKYTNSPLGYLLLNFHHGTFLVTFWNLLAASSGGNLLLNK